MMRSVNQMPWSYIEAYVTSDERITWPSQLDSTCCKVPSSNPQPRTPCTNPEQHKLFVLSSESIPRLLWSCQSHVLLWFFEGVFSLTGREFRGFPSTTSAHTTKSIFELMEATSMLSYNPERSRCSKCSSDGIQGGWLGMSHITFTRRFLA